MPSSMLSTHFYCFLFLDSLCVLMLICFERKTYLFGFSFQVCIDELLKIRIKYNHHNQPRIIPNNKYRLGQMPVDHHRRVFIKNNVVYTLVSFLLLCIFFFSVQRLFLFLSVCLSHLHEKFLYKRKKKKKKSHSVSSSFDRLFVSKNMNLYEGVGL